MIHHLLKLHWGDVYFIFSTAYPRTCGDEANRLSSVFSHTFTKLKPTECYFGLKGFISVKSGFSFSLILSHIFQFHQTDIVKYLCSTTVGSSYNQHSTVRPQKKTPHL